MPRCTGSSRHHQIRGVSIWLCIKISGTDSNSRHSSKEGTHRAIFFSRNVMNRNMPLVISDPDSSYAVPSSVTQYRTPLRTTGNAFGFCSNLLKSESQGPCRSCTQQGIVGDRRRREQGNQTDSPRRVYHGHRGGSDASPTHSVGITVVAGPTFRITSWKGSPRARATSARKIRSCLITDSSRSFHRPRGIRNVVVILVIEMGCVESSFTGPPSLDLKSSCK